MNQVADSLDVIPSFTDRFIDTVTEVLSYNDRYAYLGGIARQEQPEQVEPLPEGVSIVQKAAMEKDLIMATAAGQLSDMGISLLGASGAETDHRHAPTLMMLLVGSARFGLTLKKLEVTPANGPNLDQAVDGLLYEAVMSVRTGYLKEDAWPVAPIYKEIADEQLDMFINLVPDLTASGFSALPAHKKLAEYAYRRDADCLSDYLDAEVLDIVDTEIGPVSWPLRYGSEKLYTKWKAALSYLANLRASEEPSALYGELLSTLRADFDTGRAWLDWAVDAAEAEGTEDERFAKSIAYMQLIKQVWERDFTLENGFYLDSQNQKNTE